MTSTAQKQADYEAFLRSKIPQAKEAGFEPASAPHESLFPHQRDICVWAVKGGQRAVFANFGLGKTRIHLQIAKWVTEKTGGRYLIVAPLGVRQEFTLSEGPEMGMEIEYVRNDQEIAVATSQVLITNYERVRDGAIDVSQFSGAGLDESSVLRSFGSKTYQEFLQLFKSVRYRWVFTATPSPNRYKELIHYAGFLGVMDTGEALTRFFQRDSSQANNLTLYPHMEKQFWLWVNSWAVFIQKPSDLGYSDEGYDLPEMHVHWHKLDVDHREAWTQADSWGQSQLFVDRAQGLKESAGFKRGSVEARVTFARGLMEKENRAELQAPDPVNLREQVCDAALNHVENQWVLREILSGKSPASAVGMCGTSVPVWWQTNGKAGIMFEDGTEKRRIKWPELAARANQYTRRVGKHWLIWHDLEAERHEIENQIPGAVTVYGTQDLEEREQLIMGFSKGDIEVLATKPVIAGSGTNFQRHCADAIFLGVGYKFNDFIQAIHRIYRFQQSREVHIHIIYLESEEAIAETLKAKWRRHEELMSTMTSLLRAHKLKQETTMELTRTLGCERAEVTSEKFRAVKNDCVAELLTWPADSVDMVLTSIPFGNQYEYSPSFNDFGHNSGDEPFFQQMDFLVPELLRVLRPGRIAAVHVKDRILFGNVTGFGGPTVNPFSDKTSETFRKHGFVLLARITIDTDVVRENNQTYRLGWSENAKDSTKMGAGMPEYVLVFRKLPTDLSNAYADAPVTKSKAEYTRADWQIDASGLWRSNGNRLPEPETLRNMNTDEIRSLWQRHCLSGGYQHEQHVELAKALEEIGKLPASFMLFPPVSRNKDVWTDIARMRTLNSEQSRRNQEMHVCPLQLDIIKRLITRYTNPEDRILDPFAGIFSTVYQAIHMGRCGDGIELNGEYWRCGVGYCEMAEAECTAPTLFDVWREVSPAPTEGRAA